MADRKIRFKKRKISTLIKNMVEINENFDC